MSRPGFIFTFLAGLAPRTNAKNPCPVDGSESQILGSVAIGLDGNDGMGDAWAATVGWASNLRLCWCPRCGCLFGKPHDKEKK